MAWLARPGVCGVICGAIMGGDVVRSAPANDVIMGGGVVKSAPASFVSRIHCLTRFIP